MTQWLWLIQTTKLGSFHAFLFMRSNFILGYSYIENKTFYDLMNDDGFCRAAPYFAGSAKNVQNNFQWSNNVLLSFVRHEKIIERNFKN